MPTSLVCLVVLVCAMAFVLRGLVYWQVLALVGVVGAALAGAGMLVGRRRGSASSRLAARALALLLSMTLGAVAAGQALTRADAVASTLSHTSVSTLELVVESDASETSSGWVCRARARTTDGQAGDVWLYLGERPSYGEVLRVIGRFSKNADDDWGTTSRARGLSGSIKVVRICERGPSSGLAGALAALRERVVGLIEPAASEGRALMAAVLAQDRTQLAATGCEDVFARAGLSHLVAVSGSHLVVVGACLEALLLALGLGPRPRIACTLTVCLAYVAFCAAPVSAVRAWVMLAASRAGMLLGRRAYAPASLALTGVVLCLLNPFCACELGFTLSALSVAALALFAGHMEALLARLMPLRGPRARLRRALARRVRPFARLLTQVGRSARSTLAATLVCQLACAFPCAVSFGTLSLVAPLANVVEGPLFGVIVSLGIVACALAGVPFVGPVLFGITEALCSAAVLFARGLAALPFACVAVSFGPAFELAPILMAAVLLALWPCPSARRLKAGLAVGAALLALGFLALYVLVSPRVIVLDVGQGDAILVREGPHAILVDTGPGEAARDALARQHVLALDAVVLTHLHDDHVGGLDELVGLVQVGRVYVAEGVSSCVGEELSVCIRQLTGEGPSELCVGDTVLMGGFSLRCLWPEEPVDGADNEDSLCLALSYASGSSTLTALLTGDAESDVLETVASRVGDIDLIKVGHHGSAASITSAQAQALDAEVAVASAGEHNSYGHPTEECKEALSSAGSVFLCTIGCGDVTVEPSAAGPIVSCARSP